MLGIYHAASRTSSEAPRARYISWVAPSERVPPGDRPGWAAVVGGILEEARRRAGKGPALALRLQQLGVVGEKGERYSESSISNWIRGRAKPPAEVVLAAAQAVHISLDDRLGIGRRESGLERQVADLQGQLEVLQAQVQGLLGRPTDTQATREAGRLLGVVRHELRAAARELDLPWEYVPADVGDEALAGILQAQMMDVRGTLGLDWDSPRSGTGDLVGMARDLSRQMDEVRQRLRERRTGDVSRRPTTASE